MLPASSSGPAFQAVNTFHLRPGQVPPPLQPQAVYTYGRGESFNQVDFDVSHNLCTPFRIRTWALWLEPAGEDADHSCDGPSTTSGLDTAPATEAATVDDRPAAEGAPIEDSDVTSENHAASDDEVLPMTVEPAAADADTPVTPELDGPAPHPDAMTFDIIETAHQLPPHLQHDFQSKITAAMQMGVEYFQLTGLNEADALNQMRMLSWGFIRDMSPLEVARAKRKRYYDPAKGSGKGGPSSSAKGWF